MHSIHEGDFFLNFFLIFISPPLSCAFRKAIKKFEVNVNVQKGALR